MIATLQQVLARIEADILVLLKEKGPLTERQLFLQTKLKNTSAYGWQFALRNLLEKGKITEKGNKFALIKSNGSPTRGSSLS